MNSVYYELTIDLQLASDDIIFDDHRYQETLLDAILFDVLLIRNIIYRETLKDLY